MAGSDNPIMDTLQLRQLQQHLQHPRPPPPPPRMVQPTELRLKQWTASLDRGMRPSTASSEKVFEATTEIWKASSSTEAERESLSIADRKQEEEEEEEKQEQ